MRLREFFARHCDARLPTAKQEKAIVSLEAIERGEIDRLTVLMPPGAGMSTCLSVIFPAWFLDRNKTASILAVNKTAMLAEHFSRRALECSSGVTVPAKASSLARWETSEGGAYRAIGVGGSTLGRYDLIIIDNPLLPGEIESQAMVDRYWDWFNTAVMTRLKRDGRLVLGMNTERLLPPGTKGGEVLRLED